MILNLALYKKMELLYTVISLKIMVNLTILNIFRRTTKMSKNIKGLLRSKGLLAELEACRNEEEAINVLKREKLWRGVVNYPELEELRESYKNSEIETNGILSLNQLDKVAGGMITLKESSSKKQNQHNGRQHNRKKQGSVSLVAYSKNTETFDEEEDKDEKAYEDETRKTKDSNDTPPVLPSQNESFASICNTRVAFVSDPGNNISYVPQSTSGYSEQTATYTIEGVHVQGATHPVHPGGSSSEFNGRNDASFGHLRDTKSSFNADLKEDIHPKPSAPPIEWFADNDPSHQTIGISDMLTSDNGATHPVHPGGSSSKFDCEDDALSIQPPPPYDVAIRSIYPAIPFHESDNEGPRNTALFTPSNESIHKFGSNDNDVPITPPPPYDVAIRSIYPAIPFHESDNEGPKNTTLFAPSNELIHKFGSNDNDVPITPPPSYEETIYFDCVKIIDQYPDPITQFEVLFSLYNEYNDRLGTENELKLARKAINLARSVGEMNGVFTDKCFSTADEKKFDFKQLSLIDIDEIESLVSTLQEKAPDKRIVSGMDIKSALTFAVQLFGSEVLILFEKLDLISENLDTFSILEDILENKIYVPDEDDKKPLISLLNKGTSQMDIYSIRKLFNFPDSFDFNLLADYFETNAAKTTRPSDSSHSSRILNSLYISNLEPPIDLKTHPGSVLAQFNESIKANRDGISIDIGELVVEIENAFIVQSSLNKVQVKNVYDISKIFLDKFRSHLNLPVEHIESMNSTLDMLYDVASKGESFLYENYKLLETISKNLTNFKATALMQSHPNVKECYANLPIMILSPLINICIRKNASVPGIENLMVHLLSAPGLLNVDILSNFTNSGALMDAILYSGLNLGFFDRLLFRNSVETFVKNSSSVDNLVEKVYNYVNSAVVKGNSPSKKLTPNFGNYANYAVVKGNSPSEKLTPIEATADNITLIIAYFILYHKSISGNSSLQEELVSKSVRNSLQHIDQCKYLSAFNNSKPLI